MILQHIHVLYMTGFRKINHFVTFDTLNITVDINALYITNQPYNKYSNSPYPELPENLRSISIAT